MIKAQKDKPIFPYTIALIGFMGCGKSTVARRLHERYGIKVVEMDDVIEQKEGKTISKIFEEEGEEYFRQLETDLLLSLQEETVIISCGGGVPMRDENVKAMKASGKIVFLDATPQTIYERVKNDHSRPLLEGKKTVEYIEELMKKRMDRYKAVADLMIQVDGKDCDAICDELMERLV